MLASLLTTNLSILVLAGFVGYAVISKVPNTLHTPLMSGTNAIHGIVVLGAKWLDLGIEAAGEGGYARDLTDEEKAQQQQALTDATKGFDVVITTALVPGRPAPRLVTAEAVQGMKAGSVIVDLAGEAGGNCELTEPGQVVVKHDVTIASPLNLPSTMPEHSSALYARNVQALLELFLDDDGNLALDWDDEVVAGACVTRETTEAAA